MSGSGIPGPITIFYTISKKRFSKKGVVPFSSNTNLGFTNCRAPMYWSFPSRHRQGYVNELEHFVDVVTGKSDSSVTRQMTCAVTKIAEAAEASARQGKPVDISWKADEVPSEYVMKV